MNIDVQGLYTSVLLMHLMETSTNQMIKTVKRVGVSWALLRVGPFTGALLSDRGDILWG